MHPNLIPLELSDEITEELREDNSPLEGCIGCAEGETPERIMSDNTDMCLPEQMPEEEPYSENPVSPAVVENLNEEREGPAGEDPDKPIKRDQGEPIRVGSGEFVHTLPLHSVKDAAWGSLPVQVTYRQGKVDGPYGFAGKGTAYSYNDMIIEQDPRFDDAEKSILYQMGDGNIITFSLPPGVWLDPQTMELPTLETLQASFNFCGRDDVADATMEDGEWGNPVTYYAKGMSLVLEKKRALVAYRMPGKPCHGTWKYHYTLTAPDKNKIEFEALMQVADAYRKQARCRHQIIDDHTHLLANMRENLGGPREVRFNYECGQSGDTYRCTSNEFDLPRLYGDLPTFQLIIDLTTLFQERTRFHNQWCEEEASEGHELLREREDFFPLGNLLQVDRHPPTKLLPQQATILPGHPWAFRKVLGRDRWPEGYAASNPESQRTDFSYYLVSGLDPNPEGSEGLKVDWRMQGGWRVVENRQYRVRMGDASTQQYFYNTPVDAYLLNMIPQGIVAPLKRIVDLRKGTLEMEYDFEYETESQYLDYATMIRSLRCMPYSNPQFHIPPQETQLIASCAQEGEHPAPEGDPGMCRVLTFICPIKKNQLRGRRDLYGELAYQGQFRHSVERMDYVLPRHLTKRLKKGNKTLLEFRSDFTLQRNRQWEDRLRVTDSRLERMARNPVGRKYEPYRRVFNVVPVLKEVEEPGGSVSTLRYKAPIFSNERDCSIENPGLSFDTFLSGGDITDPIFPEWFGDQPAEFNESHFYEQGWNVTPGVIDNAFTYRDCDSLPTGGSGVYPRYLPEVGEYFNGILFLGGVDYGMEGAPRWELRYRLYEPNVEEVEDPNAEITSIARLHSVWFNDQRVVYNQYDSKGRVFRHQLPNGTLEYDYEDVEGNGPTPGVVKTTRVTTRDGVEVLYGYDSSGVLLYRREGDGTTIQTEMKPPLDEEKPGYGAGRVAAMIFPDGQRIEFDYFDDHEGNVFPYLIREKRQIGTVGNRSRVTRYTYEPEFHRVQTMTYPAPGGPEGEVTLTYRYDYQEPALNPCNREDPRGDTVLAIYPDGDFQAVTYDKLSRPLESRRRNDRVDTFRYRPLENAALNCEERGHTGRYQR